MIYTKYQNANLWTVKDKYSIKIKTIIIQHFSNTTTRNLRLVFSFMKTIIVKLSKKSSVEHKKINRFHLNLRWSQNDKDMKS